jgi:hypothetical protein
MNEIYPLCVKNWFYVHPSSTPGILNLTVYLTLIRMNSLKIRWP